MLEATFRKVALAWGVGGWCCTGARARARLNWRGAAGLAWPGLAAD